LQRLLALLPALFLAATALAQQDWEVINPANAPSARAGHSTDPTGNGSLIFFGGEDDSHNMFNDLYLYNQGNWNPLEGRNPPPARRDHAAWVANNKLYVHGGQGTNYETVFDDL
jgi:N-acetylneuraminic acid mutarotase